MQPAPSAQTAVYLNSLSELAGRSFPSTAEALEAILRLVVEQLGLRTSYLMQITCEEGRSEVLAVYNTPGGCDIARGTVLELTDTF